MQENEVETHWIVPFFGSNIPNLTSIFRTQEGNDTSDEDPNILDKNKDITRGNGKREELLLFGISYALGTAVGLQLLVSQILDLS